MSDQMQESWDKYAMHVVKELQRLNDNIESLTSEFRQENKNIWIEIAALRVKAGLWGVLGGVLAMIPAILFFLMDK